ncbi:MAG: orotate phosphoribosyltransferase [Deltaproteobacteria bacterium]|nr:orotate phosphoribosyltransferase [Deltaproteobacteria bacterium]
MERDIARSLLKIGAVTLRLDPPFTWASGRLSPIYCDNRLLMSYPSLRREVARSFAALLERERWKPEVVAGTATAGIPHAAWLADLLDLPMVYVRGSAKGHGKENRVEGRIRQGESAVLVEDLISTGGSSVDAAKGLAEAGAHVIGVAAIFTYGLDKAVRAFADMGFPLATLTSFEVLVEEAAKGGHLSAADEAVISEWRQDPAAWSKARGGAG